MAVVTKKGLKLAARNVALFPLRAFLYAGYVLFRLLLAAFVGLAALLLFAGAYFYFVKSNEPLQIDQRTAVHLPPEGMTFRELWQDRFEGWKRIDEEKTKACRFTRIVVGITAQVIAPLEKTIMVRYFPESRTAQVILANPHRAGYPPPEDLSLLDAWWWWSMNDTWWFWVDHQAICHLPPPKRPVQH
jgi:hypothetical protein